MKKIITAGTVKVKKTGIGTQIKNDYKRNKTLILLAIPVFLWYLIFCYFPMFGIGIAFTKYNVAKGIFREHVCGT